MSVPLKAVDAGVAPERVDNPLGVRQGADAVKARAEAIRRVLSAPCALPDARARAKDDLVALAREALDLWGAL